MKSWIEKTINLFLLLFCALLFLFHCNDKVNKKEIIVPDYSGTIDSLQLVIDSLNQKQLDLENKEDSVKIKIIEIEKEYETKFEDVVNQSVDSDIKFFTEYINNFSKNY